MENNFCLLQEYHKCLHCSSVPTFSLSFQVEDNNTLTSDVIGQVTEIVLQEAKVYLGTAAACLKPVGFHRICFLHETSPLLNIEM